MTGSGVINYNIPIASARTEPGEEAYSTAIGTFSKYTTTAHPYTKNQIKGWAWDKRTWSDERFENNAVSIPSNWDPSIDGITQTYFQSGIGSNHDLELESIQSVPSSGISESSSYRIWAPEINHGYYYDYNEEGYLYSDDSEIKTVTYNGIVLGLSNPTASGFNETILDSYPKTSVPIEVIQMEWNNQDGKYNIAQKLTRKVYFSGKRDINNARTETYDNNTDAILWENVDRSENEFIVTYSGNNPKVILNDQYVEEVGSGTSIDGIEILGISDGSSNQQFHSLYSPIDNTMGMEIYSYVTSSGTSILWDPIDCDQTPSGYQVCVDYDLGILEFGDTTVSGQSVPVAGSTIGARYWKTLKIEYEPDQSSDTILGIETNINPVNRRSARGFVYLATRLEDPASITLRAKLPQTQPNIFGPLYIGNEYAPLVATVKDSKGQLLEGQTVNFFITSEPTIGSFGGTSESISSFTDQNGEAHSFYSPPRGISDIGENITASNWSYEDSPIDPEYVGLSQITTLHTERLLIEGDLKDIFLYEVHVDDPLQGYLDTTSDHNNLDIQLSEYYTQFFQEYDIYGPTGLVPAGDAVSTSAIEWEDSHRMIWNLARPSIFQSNQGMGKKKLVSVLDSSMLNPHDFTPGAVGPVQPINTTSTGDGEYDVIFDTSSHSIPKPTGTDFPTASGTLHSYFLVAPTTVKMQASVFNRRLNRHIYSNEISIKLEIPSYLNGLWILDSINQSHIDEISTVLANVTASGQLVPLGFRLRSSSVTLAGALDGVTFLDVNPVTQSGVSHQIQVSTIVDH